MVNKQTPHMSNVCGVFRRGECGEKGEWNPGGMGTAGVSVCVCVCVCVCGDVAILTRTSEEASLRR